jgi:hypothetical protein
MVLIESSDEENEQQIIHQHLESLQPEIIISIFSFLNFKDYLHLNRTCKTFSTIHENSHWKLILLRQFPNHQLKQNEKNFKKIFKNLFLEKFKKQQKIKKKIEIESSQHTEEINDSMDEQEWEVDQVLDFDSQSGCYLVKWKGYNHSANTWEPKENLKNCRELIKQYKKTKKMRESQIFKIRKSPNPYTKEIENFAESLISSLKDRQIIDILDDEDDDLISGDVMTYSMIHSLISQHADQIIKIHEKFKDKDKSIENLPDIKIDGVVHNYLTLSIGTKIEKDYPEIIENSLHQETNENQPKSEIISLDDEEMKDLE